MNNQFKSLTISSNPCAELFTPINIYFNSVKKDDKKREKLVDHLLEVGWIVNYKYIEKMEHEFNKRKKNKNTDEVDIDFDVLVTGKYKGDYHLMSKCEKYVVRIKEETAAFWRKDPTWLNLGEYPLDEIKFTKKGVMIANIVRIELESEEK